MSHLYRTLSQTKIKSAINQIFYSPRQITSFMRIRQLGETHFNASIFDCGLWVLLNCSVNFSAVLRCQGTQYPVETGRINTIMPGEYVMYLWSGVQRRTRSPPIGTLAALLKSKLCTKGVIYCLIWLLSVSSDSWSGSLCKFCQTHDVFNLQSIRLKTLHLICAGPFLHFPVEQFLVAQLRLALYRSFRQRNKSRKTVN